MCLLDLLIDLSTGNLPNSEISDTTDCMLLASMDFIEEWREARPTYFFFSFVNGLLLLLFVLNEVWKD